MRDSVVRSLADMISAAFWAPWSKAAENVTGARPPSERTKFRARRVASRAGGEMVPGTQRSSLPV